MKSILIVCQNLSNHQTVEQALQSKFIIETVEDAETCFSRLEIKRYDFLFVDVDILSGLKPQKDLKNNLQVFWDIYPTIAIIVMAPQERTRQAVMFVKAGASNYLNYPVDPQEIKLVTESTQESIMVQSELDYLRDQFWQADTLDIMQTRSPLMEKVYAKVKSVAMTKSTVLILGETGTGKGVMANIIHMNSNRRENQFIQVHCGAIPETLIESEMFGHEKGAFTGAIRRKLGKFEIANSGTIFLDEIGTITPSAQIKLLQVLQDRTFQRVGGDETLTTDVRVIAATNSDLKKMCDDGLFRRDLYYRLNVFPIEIPHLKDRLCDLPLFIDNFLKELNKFSLKQIHGIHPLVLEAFNSYTWPGNIRELENLIERAYILETSDMLTPVSFPRELFENDLNFDLVSSTENMTLAQARQKGIEEIERNYLKNILTTHKGKIGKSAQASGISTRQLNKLMNKFGLKKEQFKSG
jgi:DNA-binding NtrC family response regulator